MPRAAGVVDSLSAGFGVVNEQPWIVLIPVLFDLFFLFGPRVSVAPIVGSIVTGPAFERSFGASGSTEAARAQFLSAAEDFNLLTLLSPGGVSVPSVVPLLGIARGTLTLVDAADVALGLGMAAVLVGSLLGCMYRAILAQQASEGHVHPLDVPIDALVSWGRLLALSLLLIVAAFFVIVPLAFIAALLSFVAAGASALMTAVVVTLTLIAQVYLFFAPDAIFVSRVGPLQAIRRSVAVVRAGVWSALTLAVLVTVILIGMSQVWVALSGQASWGLALSIVGNAYIASGLVAASMLFYKDRMDTILARRS